MSNALFRRSWKVTVDTLDVSGLDIEFRILSTIKPEPNKCVLTVWNLTDEHRGELLKRNDPTKKGPGIPCRIEAGYIDNTSILFDGDLREVSSKRDGADWKTTISGDDGGRLYREGNISTQFAAGASIGGIIKQCAEAMGVGMGNVSDFTASAEIAGIGSTLPHTMTLHGNAAKELTRVLSSVGLVWSIQHGALQVQSKGKPLDLGAILLTPDTGLLDSPEAAIDATIGLGNPQQFAAGAKQKTTHPPKPKDPGIVKVKSLLIPGMAPGRKIDLRSAHFRGGYMLTECEYIGQSWANDWHVNAVARVY